jgi:hypothetical protein
MIFYRLQWSIGDTQPKMIIFLGIINLLEKRLKYNNYSKKEINMSYFIQAMNMMWVCMQSFKIYFCIDFCN